jgi:rhamnosyltransferase
METRNGKASIASVTIAYNAAEVLPRQIERLLQQSWNLAEIIVVDNGSTDGTSEMLAARYPQITVLRFAQNISPGTAASIGMSHAIFEKGYDWVWIFDADSEPEPDTLRRLLNGLESLNGCGESVGILAPLLLHRAGGECYPPHYWRDGWIKPSPALLRQPVLLVDLVLGSGMMIHRQVVESIGVLHEQMAVYFQDFEYCLRAREHGYQIAVVTDARLAHEVGYPRPVRLWGFRWLWSIHKPWQEYYMARNLIYIAWHLYSNFKTKRFVVRHTLRHAIGVLLFSPRNLECLTRIAQGCLDGWTGRMGVRIPLRDSIPTTKASPPS